MTTMSIIQDSLLGEVNLQNKTEISKKMYMNILSDGMILIVK